MRHDAFAPDNRRCACWAAPAFLSTHAPPTQHEHGVHVGSVTARLQQGGVVVELGAVARE